MVLDLASIIVVIGSLLVCAFFIWIFIQGMSENSKKHGKKGGGSNSSHFNSSNSDSSNE